MAKYDSALTDLKNSLPQVKKVLVALSASLTIDSLAAGLALALSLKQSGKETSIVTADSIKVSHSNLYGVGQVEAELPKASGGNLTLTLEGVVAADGSVPSLEKLDWFPEGENLNLVFHVLPGQKFEPKRIVPKVSGSGGFDLAFVVGASALESLGSVYSLNKEILSGLRIVNIDNSGNNTKFGTLALVDPEAGTLSEMVAQVIQGLGLPFDSDSASNILAGIYESTQNLTTNVKPDTFISVGVAMQSGGKAPSPTQQPQMSAQPQLQATPQPTTPAQEYAQNFPPLNQVFGFPVTPQAPAPQPQTPANAGLDTPPVFANPPASSGFNNPSDSGFGNPQGSDNFTVPQVVGSDSAPSPEEQPATEYATTPTPEVVNPEPDWLTPKVYKGTNIG